MSSHPHISRRQFDRSLGLGVMGLGLGDALAERGQASPLTGFGKAKHVIFLFLYGGPSQIDSWDMKPDAPVEYRGEFTPITTAVPGITCSEHLPLLAKRTKDLAIVRSMTMEGISTGDHHCDAYYVLTGQRLTKSDIAQGINRKPRPDDDWPFIGSTVSYCRPPRETCRRPYNCRSTATSSVVTSFRGNSPASWVAPHESLLVRGVPDPKVKHGFKPREFRVPSFELPGEVSRRRIAGRERLLRKLNAWQGSIEGSRQVDNFNTHQQRAFRLLTSKRVKAAFDLDREPESVRNRYGNTVTAQGTLMARRLVEAGVPFVTVHWRTPQQSPLVSTWDTHADNFFHLRTHLLPELDKMLSALLEDLDQRGLLESTLVLAMGEMGRSPNGPTLGSWYEVSARA
ncbi:MAG: hypothetical protein CM1200mP2_33020 [Planctomycetaceae bacterium]|nr:MAG: hypothetical protein CM1200mP2_33020 [Planctomycetaceae bacterium]